MNIILLILLVAHSCICDNTKITLDIDNDADRSKFFEVQKNYQGVPYVVYLPHPGYEIGNVVIGGRPVYTGDVNRNKIQFVLVHYRTQEHNVPVFLLRSDRSRLEQVSVSGRTQTDADYEDVILLLMRCLRDLFPDDDFIQQRLAYMDRTEFPIRTANKVICDIFYGDRHVETVPEEVSVHEDE